MPRNSDPAGAAAALRAKLAAAPRSVADAMVAAQLAGAPLERGAAVVVADFFAGLVAAGRAPEHATTEDFRRVATSRSRFRTLLRALETFAPDVPLAPARVVKAEWDAWLNARYNARPKKQRPSQRVAHLPAAWPAAWAAALPALDEVAVNADGELLRPLKPKSRESVTQAVGMLSAARLWAAGRGVHLPETIGKDLIDAFVRYIMVERGASPRTAADYLERVGILGNRGGLLDGAAREELSFVVSCLRDEQDAAPPAKREVVRRFAASFDLGDLLILASDYASTARVLPGHSVEAERLRLRAMVFAILVNGADRQGDIHALTIGRSAVRRSDGLWELNFRQRKTGGIKESVLWPFTSSLIDAHLLGDRAGWMILDRVAELDGMNLLTLADRQVGGYPVSAWLREAFGVSGHLVRTLVVDALRCNRPDAAWAAQKLLGHTTRTMQQTYQADFRFRASLDKYQKALIGTAA